MIATLNLYTVSLFLHISAAVVGLGATFALSLAYPLAQKLGDPRHLLFVHRLNLAVVTRLASPALAVILITGIVQVIDGDLSFGEAWISAGFVLVIILGGLQGAYFARTDRKLAAQVEREIADGATELSPEYRKEAQREGGMGALAGLLTLAAIFVMVIKPGS